ncbi:MAG TPA: nitroreductase [Candidatus Lokiarchaeia archaeon]|nr:nitroreductase [Candidatus Lokiarchaeia archaeon]
MEAIECLKTRRSIRKFTSELIPKEKILEILECGRWAPSGINHQPWRVFVITNQETKAALATCTSNGSIIKNASCVFAIFLDTSEEYSYVKNVQSMGAFFENLLLAIHAMGLGGVWLGQIYNQKEQVHEVLGITDTSREFMGAIALGYPDQTGESDRMPLEDFVQFIE